MIIKVSKTFAKFINETAKERNLPFKAIVADIPASRYSFFVGPECWNDYNAKTDCFKAIKIVYKDSCYANPVYINTRELNRNFRYYAIETVEELKDMICEIFAI